MLGLRSIASLQCCAVDGRFESRGDGWSLTKTSEIASALGVTRQQITPALHQLAAQGYVHSCRQSDGSVTWHLFDKAVKVLRADREIVVQHSDGPFRRAASPEELISIA